MSMVTEMAGPRKGSIEIVIGAGLGKIGEGEEEDEDPEQAPSTECRFGEAEGGLCTSFKRNVDINRFPILKAHVLDGKPVVPFALMTEWLGHGALHENPGLYLYGLDDIRLLKGIRIENGGKTVRLMSGKARRNNGFYEADVEVRNGMKDAAGKELVHFAAMRF